MRRDLRVLKSILPGWAIAFLRRLRDLARRGRQLRLHTPRARREAALQELQALPAQPVISLVMPTYKTDLKLLREAVDSVRKQVYGEWELVIVDDGSADPALAGALRALPIGDGRIKVELLEENAGISAATNAGLALVEGEFVGFLDHDDTLTPDALLRVAQALAADPELDAVYSDSDKLTIGGVRADPFLKPDWSPVYALGAMYIGHLLVVRTSVAEAAGGFDSAFDKIQDFEFMLRVSERTGRIHHIPQTLYHWRAIPGSIAAGTEQKSGVEELQARAVCAHLERLGLPARGGAARGDPAPGGAGARATARRRSRGSASSSPPAVRGAAARALALAPSSRPSTRTSRRSSSRRAAASRRSPDRRHPAPSARARQQPRAAAAAGEYLLFLAPDPRSSTPAGSPSSSSTPRLPDVAAVGPQLARPDGKVEQAGHRDRPPRPRRADAGRLRRRGRRLLRGAALLTRGLRLERGVHVSSRGATSSARAGSWSCTPTSSRTSTSASGSPAAAAVASTQRRRRSSPTARGRPPGRQRHRRPRPVRRQLV